MALVVKAHGSIEQILVTSLPNSFVSKVFRHCWGKNNTPYFAGNCFKGVLYFDERMAASLAKDEGFSWNGWLALPKYQHLIAAVFESGLELTAFCNGVAYPIGTSSLVPKTRSLRFSDVAPRIAEDHVAALLGSVDKGSMVFSLKDVEGDFDPGKLSATLTRLDDFSFEDALLTGMGYDGREMSMEMGESRGMGMIDPVLIGKDGGILDMYDFTA
ncbi:hypothetical protein [Desulfolutivibrio sulfoxidireducens]|uniref:hypothetical protein n=1 Tax=Desulfolutivibrio sulfoxidireducens TaxID=2773299 RepID=UPI00159E0512|nr:hypothetical protein [Desulfolutivibrio sulfoxidireducens]QLA15744.1 hypothetical protein GD605_06080 [Desulfolutivibrio sulfoxidireducens]QLA19349.1 hypothetical protein GD604_06105 [Desulfolutivibrio sulfoxidireducens]